MNLKSIEFEVNSNIKTIGKSVFSDCSIEKILIPSNIEKIEESTFSHCKKLKSVDFENDSQITSIGKQSFYFCENLQTVKFPLNSKLNSILQSAFYQTAIQEISIPQNVTVIGEDSFAHCPKIKCVNFLGESKLKLIENNAFSFSSLQYISIPPNVSMLSISYCSFLKSIEFLGEKLIFGDRCFCNCIKFSIFSLPNAHSVVLKMDTFQNVSSSFTLFICANANLTFIARRSKRLK